MLRNYFKSAWRNIIRHTRYSIINIAGLAVGIAACLLLFSVVRYELSYDKFQPNYKRIYHVAARFTGDGGVSFGEGLPFPAYDGLRVAFPEAIVGAVFQDYNCQVTVLDAKGNDAGPDKKFYEETGVFFSDAQFFSVFNYKWIAGSAAALNLPGMAVITTKMGDKYFGNWRNAMGKLISIDNSAVCKVAGIIGDAPGNTDFPITVVGSYESMKQYPDMYGYRPDWSSVTSSFQVFMRLQPNASEEAVNRQFINFCNEHYDNKNSGKDKISYFLQPLSDIHFNKSIGNFGDHITSKSTLWTLSLIGLFIIIMACINFINLSTAQAVGRSKEIGLRKVLGSTRKQLFWQVMGETFIIELSAMLLATLVAFFCMPLIKNVASIQEHLSVFNMPSILFMLLATIAITLFAGSYPSLILSGFKPVLALKNKITSASIGGISLRRMLVISQFTISQVLIIGTIVAISQMNYIRNADLGYNKDALLVLNSNSDSAVVMRQPAFKHALLSINGVQSVSLSSDVPSSQSNNSGNFAYDHKPEEKFEQYRKYADDDYVKTYGLRIVAGKNFEKSDTLRDVLVNETMVKMLGMKSNLDVVGHQIRVGKIWLTISGVVGDFKTNSMREAVKPLVIGERNTRYYFAGIKLRTSNLHKVQAQIQKAWNDFFPEYVYNPSFMDQRIKDFYVEEDQLTLLYKIFALIAILISCLGLYGLVSFMVAQKTKEVGIRKVLGASISNIVYLFSKEFTILILVAFAIAVPIANYMMSGWLKNFAFRISPGVGIFFLSILSSVFIAWLTVGYKSVKAAIANPVKSIRNE